MGMSMDQLPASFAARPAILAVVAVDWELSFDQIVNKLKMPLLAAYCGNSFPFACWRESSMPWGPVPGQIAQGAVFVPENHHVYISSCEAVASHFV
jgi:hypothetical protein